ncbi:MAG: magnesium transporter [Nitrospiraceae bacterium]|nr:MAG: magnesium transporter [Nitrospiraceae bacterium]
MEDELQHKRETVEALLEAKDYDALKELLQGHPAEIAELIDNLPPEERTLIFRLLNKDSAVEVFEHVDSAVQSEILSGFHDARLIGIVDAMSPDDRARLFDELPASVVKKLLGHLTPEEWTATLVLLGYREDTAGRIMTPEFFDVKDNMTVEEALKRIKRIGKERETIYYLYVVDETRHLLGVVSLKRIVLSEPDVKIGEIMNREVIKVSTDDDQEEVARVISDYDFLAVPVVDKEGRLVGIATVDDIIDIIEEEATEDILRGSGVEVAERGYFESTITSNFSKRIGWMALLLGLNSLTGNIIIGHKEVIEGIVILSAFIPVLIGSGGNAGAQSSTVVIRGLAIGEIDVSQGMRILLREISLGLFIGISLGAAATLWAYWLQGTWPIAIVVGMSFVFVITIATTIGSFLPMLVKMIGFDPALIATPLITSTIDVTALLIYFMIARSLLGID